MVIRLAVPALAAVLLAAGPTLAAGDQASRDVSQKVKSELQLPPERLIGRKVHATAGNDLGKIEDVLVTPDGNVKAVIAVGGDLQVLGADKERVVIDWDKLSFTPGKELVANVAVGELKAAPDWLQEGAGSSDKKSGR